MKSPALRGSLLIVSGLMGLFGLFFLLRSDGDDSGSGSLIVATASASPEPSPGLDLPPETPVPAATQPPAAGLTLGPATATRPSQPAPTQPAATSPPSPGATRTPIPERVSLQGTFTRFDNFPGRFFSESMVDADQVIRVADAQYQSLRKLHGGFVPYGICVIEYEASHYGSTTPRGLKLGDAAFPALNGGNPRWEVMAHEQGHNFFGGTSPFYIAVAVPGPLLQESLAVVSAFYSYQDLMTNQRSYGLGAEAVASLTSDFANGRAYQEGRYQEYLRRGRPFNGNDVLTSQALDYKVILLAEQYGWSNLERLARAFRNDLAVRFTFQTNGTTVEEQSTYIVAALSVAFRRDLRVDFHDLNFPIDPQLYGVVFETLVPYLN